MNSSLMSKFIKKLKNNFVIISIYLEYLIATYTLIFVYCIAVPVQFIIDIIIKYTCFISFLLGFDKFCNSFFYTKYCQLKKNIKDLDLKKMIYDKVSIKNNLKIVNAFYFVCSFLFESLLGFCIYILLILIALPFQFLISLPVYLLYGIGWVYHVSDIYYENKRVLDMKEMEKNEMKIKESWKEYESKQSAWERLFWRTMRFINQSIIIGGSFIIFVICTYFIGYCYLIQETLEKRKRYLEYEKPLEEACEIAEVALKKAEIAAKNSAKFTMDANKKTKLVTMLAKSRDPKAKMQLAQASKAAEQARDTARKSAKIAANEKEEVKKALELIDKIKSKGKGEKIKKVKKVKKKDNSPKDPPQAPASGSLLTTTITSVGKALGLTSKSSIHTLYFAFYIIFYCVLLYPIFKQLITLFCNLSKISYKIEWCFFWDSPLFCSLEILLSFDNIIFIV